jgi:hypothetical protein
MGVQTNDNCAINRASLRWGLLLHLLMTTSGIAGFGSFPSDGADVELRHPLTCTGQGVHVVSDQGGPSIVQAVLGIRA